MHGAGSCHDPTNSGIAKSLALVYTGCATATRGAAMCFDVMQQRGGIASAVSPDICDPIDPCSFATMQGASR